MGLNRKSVICGEKLVLISFRIPRFEDGTNLPLLPGLEVLERHQWLHAQWIRHLHDLRRLDKVHFAGAELSLGIDLDAHLV